MMPTGLRLSLAVVDITMLAYWSLAALALAGAITLPASNMYRGYGTPLIDAWNWSFAPLDVLFALTGLASVRLAARGDARWRGLAIVSLALTGCAGLMAIAFWALTGDFDVSWWIPNLLLRALPLYWLPRLIRELA